MTPEQYHSTGATLKWLLAIAWLLPLAGFAVEVFGGYWGSRKSKAAAWMAVGCIATGFVCSAAALLTWGSATHWSALELESAHAEHAAGGRHTPIAAMTAHAMPGDREKSLGSGASDHITKPVDPGRLLLVLKSWMA